MEASGKRSSRRNEQTIPLDPASGARIPGMDFCHSSALPSSRDVLPPGPGGSIVHPRAAHASMPCIAGIDARVFNGCTATSLDPSLPSSFRPLAQAHAVVSAAWSALRSPWDGTFWERQLRPG